MLMRAMMEMMLGDTRRIWADWEDHRLASSEEVKPWVDKMIRRVRDAEEIPAKAHPPRV